MPYQNGYYNNKGGYGGKWNKFQAQTRQEEPSYTKAHPISKEWFTQGADANLVKYAEQVGKDLKEAKDNNKGELTNSKIRSIYGEIKRIQMGGWEKNKSSFYLLKPKVAYAYGREVGDKKVNKGLKIFKDIFDDAFDFVSDDRTYNNFCNFMEAILAYHKAFGGR